MGMPKIELRVQMFRGDWDQIWSQLRLLWAMEGLCRINQTHIRQFDEFVKRGLVEKAYPPIYRAGLHYETEKGTEIWPDIPSLISGVMGPGLYPGAWGDCEDFACSRVAEYRELPFHYSRPVTPAMFKAWQDSEVLPKDAKPSNNRLERGDPRFPQGEAELAASKANKDWPGWRKEKGGIKAKPFAKWRRGPQGNYHYHALTLMPDGRLEDPSLVLGMGREKEFSDGDFATKMKDASFAVRLQYAKAPKVMVVDPEKPSGFAGGQAVALDTKVKEMIAKGLTPEDMSVALGDAEVGAYMTNTIALSDGEFDVDAVIGWNRLEGRFEPKTEQHELRRLAGYANHG